MQKIYNKNLLLRTEARINQPVHMSSIRSWEGKPFAWITEEPSQYASYARPFDLVEACEGPQTLLRTHAGYHGISNLIIMKLQNKQLRKKVTFIFSFSQSLTMRHLAAYHIC